MGPSRRQLKDGRTGHSAPEHCMATAGIRLAPIRAHARAFSTSRKYRPVPRIPRARQCERASRHARRRSGRARATPSRRSVPVSTAARGRDSAQITTPVGGARGGSPRLGSRRQRSSISVFSACTATPWRKRSAHRVRWRGDPPYRAVTGYDTPEDLARAEAAGFDHHFRKPAEVDSVLRLLHAYTRG